jgi:hypothetical protein
MPQLSGNEPILGLNNMAHIGVIKMRKDLNPSFL